MNLIVNFQTQAQAKIKISHPGFTPILLASAQPAVAKDATWPWKWGMPHGRATARGRDAPLIVATCSRMPYGWVSGPRRRAATMNKMAILLVICSYATMGRAFLVSSPLSGLQVVILMCLLF